MANKTYRDIVLESKPELYWRFNEATGSVADHSGNNRDGAPLGATITYGVTGALSENPSSDFTIQGLASGAVGTGVQFTQTDGVNKDRFRATNYKPFQNGRSMTLEGWAWRDQTNRDDALLGDANFDLRIPTGTTNLSLWMNRGASATASVTWASVWPTAQWVYWAIVIDEVGDTAELYINGASQGSQALANSTSYATATWPLEVGASIINTGTGAASFGWKGKLDEIAVYGKALQSYDITQHYNYGQAPDKIYKETVLATPQPKPTPTISIDFSPHRDAFSYSVGATTYVPANTFYAHVGEALTLTATVVLADSVREWIVGYEWDFGDGTKGFGNPVTHTYSFNNPHTQVGLTVTDNLNRKWRARKAMYLKEQ